MYYKTHDPIESILFFFRKYLVERHFPLTQSDANQHRLLFRIDSNNETRLIEPGDANPVVRPQRDSFLFQFGLGFDGPGERGRFFLERRLLPLCRVAGGQGIRLGLFR